MSIDTRVSNPSPTPGFVSRLARAAVASVATAGAAVDTMEYRTTSRVAAPATSSAGDDAMSKIPAFARKYFTIGNKVTPLFDPQHAARKDEEIFAEVSRMLKSAKSSIQIEMFNIDKKDMVDLLIREAKNGIKVQVVMDPPSQDWEADRKVAIDRLRQGGVDVLLYPAKEAGDPQAKYGQLDHVKMLLVDGKHAIIGGMNWGEHSPNNHDYDVKVEGPAVEKMGWLFREDWLASGGQQKDLPRIQKVPAPAGGTPQSTWSYPDLDANEKTIGKTIDRAIDNARKSVHAELFVLSDRPTIQALKAAHARGVDVKVVLNPLKIKDNKINEKAYAELKAAGVPVKWYVCNKKTSEKLHAKIANFDDDQVVVGSANWSYAGFNTNREADVEILSTEVNGSFEAVFQDDWKHHTADKPTYLEDGKDDAGG